MSGYSLTDTYSSLIDEVLTSLGGFGTQNDQVCSLTADVAASGAVSVSTDDASLSRGLYEIDEEIMWATSGSNGVLTVPAWGRGWKGTTPAAHTNGSMVSVAPLYPRAIVAREVRNTIRALYPALFGVATYEFTISGGTFQYGMPADCEHILDVEWKYDLTITGWQHATGWELTHSTNTTDFPTGKALAMNDLLASGVSVLVRYAKRPTLPVDPTDTFASTGLPESSRDVVVYGAAARLLPFLDAGRLPVDTVMSDQQDAQKPVGNAVSVAREFRSLYAKRLQEERALLLDKYPMRAHKVR